MRFLADENIDNRILRGIKREDETVDIIRVQDTELFQMDDPTILEWAAKEGRILLTHDVNTIPKYAYDRINENKPMPGIIAIHLDVPIGEIIADFLMILGASEAEEYEGQVVYLPLKVGD